MAKCDTSFLRQIKSDNLEWKPKKFINPWYCKQLRITSSNFASGKGTIVMVLSTPKT